MKELWEEYTILIITAMVLIFIFVGTSFYVGGAGVLYQKTIGKWRADVDREIFEHSQSYVDGINQEAQKLYLEYISLDDETKKEAYEGVIRSKFADVNVDLIKTPEVRKFISDIKLKK